MGTLAIEINDAGLAVASGDKLLAVEPGYALVDNSEIRTGQAAYSQARLKPQLVSNRYWSNISLDPAAAGGVGRKNPAELAFAHIRKLWSEFGDSASEAILVVPSHFGPEHLGLLLGLAQECGISVRAMVDSAVAATLRAYPGRRILYVDAGLHRVSVAQIDQVEEATVGPSLALETTGIASITDAFAKRIAQAFVLASRFDPMHDAVSEQRLYDLLPQWLDELHASNSIEAVLTHGEDEFRVEIEREQILAVAAGFYRAIVQLIAQSRSADMPLVVQVTHRLASLPGLTAELARLDDAEIVTLPNGHAALAVLARADAIDSSDGTVRLLKHLPWHESQSEAPMPETPREDAPASVIRDTRQPTHIVYRGIAYGLSNGQIVVGRAQVDGRRTIVLGDENTGVSRQHFEVGLRDGEVRLKDLSRYGTYVNEKPVSGETSLRPADVIRVGTPGAELHVITVEGSDEA